jgi:hypothetical protein
MPGAGAPRVEPVARNLWAIVAEVPLTTYGPSALESHLADLSWVAEAAVAHESVVGHALRVRGATVVPMKLFTMFSSVGKARQALAGGRAVIDAAVRRIAGCEEWGVRIVRDTARSGKPAADRAATKRPASASGAAFLAARKAARDTEQASRQALFETADEVFDGLARIARDNRRRDRSESPGSNPPVLDAAFLVTARARARFRAAARRAGRQCASAGGAMTLTGPWPAYSFVGGAA